MKKLQYLFNALSLILSHLMCIFVAYNYHDILCIVLAFIFCRKAK